MTFSEIEQHQLFLRSFTAHEPAIRAYVRRLVPTRADADDIMQDVSVVLWNKFGEFRQNGDFRAWAFGVSRYEVLAWRRDKARDRLVLDEEVVEKIAAESATDEPRLQKQRDALEACLQKVDANQRELLMESYQQDSQIQEVAARSGRTIPGFYQWLHRIRKILQNCIRNEIKREELS